MAERLRDVVKFGSIDDLARTLVQQQDRLYKVADTLFCMARPREKAWVVANICRATSRQLKILQLNLGSPIEAVASACRMIFELNLVLRWVSLSDGNLDGFVARTETNEIDLYKAFLKLSTDGEQANQNALRIINEWKEKLEKKHELSNHRNTDPKDPLVVHMARVVGVEIEYEVFYRFYCKYVHPSSWLVNAAEEYRDHIRFRSIFATKAQFYAGDTCGRAEQLTKGQ